MICLLLLIICILLLLPRRIEFAARSDMLILSLASRPTRGPRCTLYSRVRRSPALRAFPTPPEDVPPTYAALGHAGESRCAMQTRPPPAPRASRRAIFGLDRDDGACPVLREAATEMMLSSEIQGSNVWGCEDTRMPHWREVYAWTTKWGAVPLGIAHCSASVWGSTASAHRLISATASAWLPGSRKRLQAWRRSRAKWRWHPARHARRTYLLFTPELTPDTENTSTPDPTHTAAIGRASRQPQQGDQRCVHVCCCPARSGSH